MSKKTDQHEFKMRVRRAHDWYRGMRRKSAQVTREDLQYGADLPAAEADALYNHIVAAEKHAEVVPLSPWTDATRVPNTSLSDFETAMRNG